MAEMWGLLSLGNTVYTPKLPIDWKIGIQGLIVSIDTVGVGQGEEDITPDTEEHF